MIKTPPPAALALALLFGLAPASAMAGDAGGRAANPLDPAPPAAAAEKLPDWLSYQPQSVNLRQAHRADEEVAAWAQARVTDALTLPHAGLNAKLKGLRAGFSETGWAQYAQLLQQANVAAAVQGQGLDLGAVADGAAHVTGQGDNGQRYQWTVALPLMLTYSRGAERAPSRQMTVNATVVRKAPAADHVASASDTAADDLEITGLQVAAAGAAGALPPK